MYMVMYVSRNEAQASDMLNIWIETGISGVTILESSGLSQFSGGGIRADVGLVFSLQSLMRAKEVHHRTLFCAVTDEDILRRVVDASTRHVGDWARPDVGVLFVWPLTGAYGLDKKFE